ncbi:MAG: biopolymer transporter ExbD [Akkermansiaceae bacterium]|nr:biopolymer transporter ExbD [Akkermansiaceae bacterium]MCP5549379.1 biopolymer transporter ExbD [Akkermansiaceae bacterium]
MRTKRGLFPGKGLQVDMSPMIDLVFLLLIFFMVSSTMITNRVDPNVLIPAASAAKVPTLVQGRVVINVYADGTLKDDEGRVLDLAGVETRMRRAKTTDPSVRLLIRADRVAAHRYVKDVVDASAKGGVSSVIFSTYVTD